MGFYLPFDGISINNIEGVIINTDTDSTCALFYKALSLIDLKVHVVLATLGKPCVQGYPPVPPKQKGI